MWLIQVEGDLWLLIIVRSMGDLERAGQEMHVSLVNNMRA